MAAGVAIASYFWRWFSVPSGDPTTSEGRLLGLIGMLFGCGLTLAGVVMVISAGRSR